MRSVWPGMKPTGNEAGFSFNTIFAKITPTIIDPIIIKPASIESSYKGLSIGTGFIKNGSILVKL